MNTLHMVTFRCHTKLLARLERFANRFHIDRTSVLKLALHYHLGPEGEPEA